MMAAFIIAIKGTVRQAVMLGLAATLSHTAIVWLIAFGGMYFSQKFTAEAAEPRLQLVSAFIILGTAIWMFWRTRRGERNWLQAMQDRDAHHHDDETQIVDTGHGQIALSIFEEGEPPRWRIRTLRGNRWAAGDVSLATRRSGSSFAQMFSFVDKGDYLESAQTIPEPHDFNVRLTLGHQRHTHDYDLAFHEHHHHELDGLEEGSQAYQDAHERAHANDIQRRFDGRGGHQLADLTVRPDRRIDSLPGGDHRTAYLHPAQSPDLRCDAGPLFQHRPGADAGHRRRWRGGKRSPVAKRWSGF